MIKVTKVITDGFSDDDDDDDDLLLVSLSAALDDVHNTYPCRSARDYVDLPSSNSVRSEADGCNCVGNH